MKRFVQNLPKMLCCIVLTVAILVLPASPGLMLEAGGYDLIWSRFGGTQGSSTSNGFDLQGHSSQFLPGLTSGSGYTLTVFLGGTPVLMGDVNSDRNIDVGDAILVLRHIVGLTTLTGNGLAASDVNRDGQVDVGDAILILRFIVGLVPSL